MKRIFLILVVAFLAMTAFSQKGEEVTSKENPKVQKLSTEKSLNAFEVFANINGEDNLTLNKQELKVMTIEAHRRVESKIKSDNSNFNVDNFTVLYEVAEYKLKIPGQPAQIVQGNQLDLTKYSKLSASESSLYIFDIVYYNGKKENGDEKIYNKLNPISIEIL